MKGMKFLGLLILSALVAVDPAFAEATAEAASSSSSYLIPLGAGIAISIAAHGGALGQAKAVGAALEAIGRNPSAAGKMTAPLFVGLALIESLVILSFVIANNILSK